MWQTKIKTVIKRAKNTTKKHRPLSECRLIAACIAQTADK
jgi:hypothetical protein